MSFNNNNNKPNPFDGIPIKHLTDRREDGKLVSGVAEKTQPKGNKRDFRSMERFSEGTSVERATYPAKRKPANLKSSFSADSSQKGPYLSKCYDEAIVQLIEEARGYGGGWQRDFHMCWAYYSIIWKYTNMFSNFNE